MDTRIPDRPICYFGLRKFLILTHRYLGIAVCLLFVMWFVSGIAMIFARGMPGLTPDVRMQHLPVLDISGVKLTAAEAAEKAQFDRPPNRVTLLTIKDRPVYRFSSGGSSVTVFADTGDPLDDVGQPDAIKIAARFTGLPEAQLHYAGELLEPDQWTLEERRILPAHKLIVGDAAHTHLYVSEETAEVALITTRGSRALALDVLRPAATKRALMAASGALDFRRGVRPGAHRHHSGFHAILYAILRPHALALCVRSRVRSLLANMGF